jgi:hypothetical protein
MPHYRGSRWYQVELAFPGKAALTLDRLPRKPQVRILSLAATMRCADIRVPHPISGRFGYPPALAQVSVFAIATPRRWKDQTLTGE